MDDKKEVGKIKAFANIRKLIKDSSETSSRIGQPKDHISPAQDSDIISQEDILEGEDDDSPVPEEEHKESMTYLKEDMANERMSRNHKMPMKGRAVKTQVVHPADRQSAPIQKSANYNLLN